MRQLEVCAADIESVMAAAAGGARRVELCSGLSEDGMTPSAGFIREALKVKNIKIHVLVRHRPGDFVYAPQEIDIMCDDILQMRQWGVHGVVMGALTAEGDVDMEACRRMMACAEGMSVTFHRAFDVCRNARQALEEIISLGCDRILTSGQARTATAGAARLRELHKQAAGRIILLAGGGVTPLNAAELLRLSGVDELHGSLRTAKKALKGSTRLRTDPGLVRQMIEIIQQL